MRPSLQVALVASLVVSAVAAAAVPEKLLLVVCVPGSPGTTEDAQPRMDSFASTLSAKAGADVSAIYEPTAAGGVKRLSGAALGIVSLPFFLAHEKDLGLHARMVVLQEGRPAMESWTLVAQKGRIRRADQLAGLTIASSAGFAPAFVRASVQAFGSLPNNVKIEQTPAVLSALRRAANGEPVAVLLDATQAQALSSLPFASKLEVVTRSPAWPAILVVTVGTRLSEKAWEPIRSALLGLASDQTTAQALGAIKIAKFGSLDEKSLASARQAYERTARAP